MTDAIARADPLAALRPEATASRPVAGLGDLDGDAFLTLLVEQMRAQDPTDPQSATDYLAQLASFAEVEQSVAIRGAVDRAGLASTLEAAGVRVLQNEAAPLTLPGETAQPLYVVGVGSHIANEDDPETALAQVPEGAPRLAVMHHPTSFLKFPANTMPLAFAAHTHGGQFRLPFTPEWSWMTFSEADEVHADGWTYDFGEAGNRLYINRGIGFSVVPFRLNAPPELTLVTLSGDAQP